MCETSAICPLCQGNLSDSNELTCSSVTSLGEKVERTYQCRCGAVVNISAEVVSAAASGKVGW